MPPPDPAETVHGTAVAIGGSGLLIVGRPGSGKSSLALQIIALGATLVADDKVRLTVGQDGRRLMSPPPAIAGMIEARGVGLLRIDWVTAPVTVVVTLDEVEGARLPEVHETVMAGVALPLLRKVESPAFPAMLVTYLRGERVAP